MPQVSAWDTALRLLSYRDRTQQELTFRLRQKGYSNSEVEEAILKMQELGFADDNHYAQEYVLRRIRQNNGPQRIRYELQGKGVAAEIIDQVLSSAFPPGKEEAQINQFLEKHINTTNKDEMKTARKTGSLLIRRGFNSEIVWKLLREKLDI